MEILFENALIFEKWPGAIPHNQIMEMPYPVRRAYVGLAQYISKKQNEQMKNPQSSNELGDFDD